MATFFFLSGTDGLQEDEEFVPEELGGDEDDGGDVEGDGEGAREAELEGEEAAKQDEEANEG
jgi:hypothetical protein